VFAYGVLEKGSLQLTFLTIVVSKYEIDVRSGERPRHRAVYLQQWVCDLRLSLEDTWVRCCRGDQLGRVSPSVSKLVAACTCTVPFFSNAAIWVDYEMLTWS
jgi:hypothetical protein